MGWWVALLATTEPRGYQNEATSPERMLVHTDFRTARDVRNQCLALDRCILTEYSSIILGSLCQQDCIRSLTLSALRPRCSCANKPDPQVCFQVSDFQTPGSADHWIIDVHRPTLSAEPQGSCFPVFFCFFFAVV